jgi:polysaccharide deacetylase family protein (PEP-CTERM system associated)
MVNAITVDVEEYFHATEVQQAGCETYWKTLPSRLRPQVHTVLERFEAKNLKGTFFILGWVAGRFPSLIREIADAGHEIACHSHAHRLVYELSPAEFRADTRMAVAAIQFASGIAPRIYRAPSYSITQQSLWALDILIEEGFTHDSSTFPSTTIATAYLVSSGHPIFWKLRPGRFSRSLRRRQSCRKTASCLSAGADI